MEGPIAQFISHPVVASYLLNTVGSVVDMASTVHMYYHDGNKGEESEALGPDAMERDGPINTAVHGELMRRLGFGIAGAALLGVDRLIEAGTGFRPHFTEIGLSGAGIAYGYIGLLNFASTIGTPRTGPRKKY